MNSVGIDLLGDEELPVFNSDMKESKDKLIALLKSENQMLSEKLQKDKMESQVPYFVTKPKDIPVLTLDELHEFTASTRLNQFFDLIENCVDNDHLRLQVAKSRVDINLVALIQDAGKRIRSWEALKQFLTIELSVEFNQDRAWQELEAQRYDWSESPQAFAHKMMSQYAVLKNNFPCEVFPNKIKTIKRKLLKGMPENCQETLEGYMESDYPLNKFMDRLDHERQFLLREDGKVHRIKNEKGKIEKEVSVNQEEMRKELEGQIDCLSKQIADLNYTVTQAMRRQGSDTNSAKPQANVQPQYRKYCAYCESTTHHLRDCRCRPPKGHCFECHQFGCWRGKPGCPGKSHRQAGAVKKSQEKGGDENSA